LYDSLQQNIIAGVTAVYPAYSLSGLTPETYDRLINVLLPTDVCAPTQELVTSNLLASQFARRYWHNDTVVQEWRNRVAVGGEKAQSPTFFLVGENDVA
jgi:hypothetical protein